VVLHQLRFTSRAGCLPPKHHRSTSGRSDATSHHGTVTRPSTLLRSKVALMSQSTCSRYACQHLSPPTRAPPPHHLHPNGHITGYSLQSGADISVFNTMGWSPLHCAASSGNAEMVSLLLQVTTTTVIFPPKHQSTLCSLQHGANAAAADIKRKVRVCDVMQGAAVVKLVEDALSR
jgi:hypothetical protein